MDRSTLRRALDGLTDEQLLALVRRDLAALDRGRRLRGGIGAEEPGLLDRFSAAAASARDGYLNTLRAVGGAGMDAARAGRDFWLESASGMRDLAAETAAQGADVASASIELLGERAGNAYAGLGRGLGAGLQATGEGAGKGLGAVLEEYLGEAGPALLVMGVGALVVLGGAGYVLLSGGGQALLAGAGKAVGTGVGGLLSGAGQAAGGTARAVGAVGVAAAKAL